MDSKKIKKMIICLGAILIFILILFILLIISSSKQKENPNNEIINISEETEVGFEQINDKEIYYTINNILNEYISYIQQINGDQYIEYGKLNITFDEAKEQFTSEAITTIKNILDYKYITELNITDEKIIEEQKKYLINGSYKEQVIYNLDIKDIFTVKLNNNIVLAMINATLNKNEFNVIIKLDFDNEAYSIFLQDYIEKYGYSDNMSLSQINISSDAIKNNGYNKFMNVTVTDEYVITQYFSEYRMKMLQNIEKAYELLDEEYKTAKFGSIAEFQKYVSDKKQTIEIASIQGYQVNKYDDYTQYVCIDQYGRYYIFNEYSVMNYNVILDTYTIDIPEFTEKYNKSNDAEKAGMNVQKILDSLNDKDYKYAYGKLDETFKQNNFKTLEEFTNYWNKNTYEYNTMTFDNYQNSGDLHMYTVTIKDKNNEASPAITKTFIVKLTEGTDFVMSFNV